jgi:putative membrane-bound dehydrogenase-like protein
MMKRHFLSTTIRLATSCLLVLTGMCTTAAAGEARRLNVLMLGHKPGSHPGHITEDRYAQLFAALGPRGIDLEFTDDVNYALNAQTLKHFDALALYANTEQITTDQEKALFDFVESGHGFVPIHCASFCFLNRIQATALIGGRFKRHQTGEFNTVITQPDHEIMKGFVPFKTWDETYVHEMHNPDKIVLQTRVELKANPTDIDEPWTWVRNQGKGRVFYTAYGHDARTWAQPGFHDLMFRGIVWAVGDTAAADFKKLKIAPLEYVDGAEVPNYEKRNPAPKLQKPLSPADAQNHIFKPANMNLTLFASEADAEGGLWNVIEFKFDELGRMWTCESRDYPNEIKLQGEGRDRIRILEDTNNDGKADKYTVFAEGISIPTSLVFHDGGIIVHTIPNTTFFKDTNGDGKSDEKKVLFTGWGAGDTHACCSSMSWGPDGWVYGSVGYNGFDGTVSGERVKFSMGAYRFKPDGSKLESLGQTSNNTWGFAFTENGDILGSTANNQSSWYCPIPKRYYNSVPGLEQGILPGVDANKKVAFMREYIRQVDVMGGFTAAACHNFYTARAFPQSYWNRTAFIAEPTCHVLYQGQLRFDGTNAVVENGWNLLASDDEWFAPVYADVGPDGGVYVSDFYSFIIQHNPTPSASRGGFDAKTGKGNAFVSDLRDTEHARLWKVFPKDGKPSQQFKLSKDKPEVLLKALASDNQLWRGHAQRLLVERGNKDVAPILKEMVADPKVDAVGVNGGAYGALWTLAQLGEADAATLTKALSHPATGVQRAAISLLPKDAAGLAALQSSGALSSKESLVRLTALLALSEMPATKEVGQKLYEQATKDAGKDRWLPTALVVSAARHAEGFLTSAIKADASTAAPPANGESANLLVNASFEDLDGTAPKGWRPSTYGGKAEFTVDSNVSHTGKNSLRIDSSTGADAGWYIELPMEENTNYVLTGYIKTEKIETIGKGHGVMLELQKLGDKQPATAPLKGTADWTLVTLPFVSGSQKSLGINLLYGGWGFATGTAWWDDVKLVKLGSVNQSEAQIQQVANAFIRQDAAAATAVLTPLLATAKGNVGKVISAALAAGGATAKKEDLNDLKKTHTIVKVAIVAGQMKYDKAIYNAPSGKPIAIALYNPDVLQHNIVAGKPGSLDKIGNAATTMVTQPDGLAKSFIPAIPEVLAGTGFANPNELLILKLPKLEKGDYPLVCTFPGHWLIMKAVLKVE